MLYFDTSFLVPLFLEEASSGSVAEFIAGLPVGTLAVSHWTLLEFSSLLAREVRMGGLDPGSAREVEAQFDVVVRASFVLWAPGLEEFKLARRYVGQYGTGLRSGDALHLAIATANQAEMVYSLDRTMLKAGETLGVAASTGISAA